MAIKLNTMIFSDKNKLSQLMMFATIIMFWLTIRYSPLAGTMPIGIPTGLTKMFRFRQEGYIKELYSYIKRRVRFIPQISSDEFLTSNG